MPLNPTADLLLFDAVETVSLQRYTTAGVLSSTETGVKGLRRDIDGSLMQLGEGAQAFPQMAYWHLQASSVASTPRYGDRIVSVTSGSWVIIDVDTQTLGTRYRCHCQKAS